MDPSRGRVAFFLVLPRPRNVFPPPPANARIRVPGRRSRPNPRDPARLAGRRLRLRVGSGRIRRWRVFRGATQSGHLACLIPPIIFGSGIPSKSVSKISTSAGTLTTQGALIYFEEARLAYWDAVVRGSRIEEVVYLLAEVKVRYRRRIRYPMKVDVGVRVSHLARRHFLMDYEARSGKGDLLIAGSSVQVTYDYATEASIVIPGSVRSEIEAWDGPFAQAGASGCADDRR